MSYRHLLLIHDRLRFYGFLISVRNALKNTYAYMTNNFNSSKSVVSICSCSLIIDHIYGRSKKMSTKETLGTLRSNDVILRSFSLNIATTLSTYFVKCRRTDESVKGPLIAKFRKRNIISSLLVCVLHKTQN